MKIICEVDMCNVYDFSLVLDELKKRGLIKEFKQFKDDELRKDEREKVAKMYKEATGIQDDIFIRALLS